MPLDAASGSYRPLQTPLPSHPGLSTRKSSYAADSLQASNAGSLAASTSALSAISALLGQSRTSAASGRQPSSLLTRRRGKDSAGDFSLDRLGARSLGEDLPPVGADGRREKLRRVEPEHDMPPSPVGLPGAWIDRPSDSHGALLLPPPFLDDRSTPQSFEGVLGTRFARETSARARREARNYARDRPPAPAFPASILATASKLVNALGPPGGVDSGPMYRRWKDDPSDTTPGTIRKERRQVERAEKGMRGYEYSERIARRIAARLRREGMQNSEIAAPSDGQQAEKVVRVTREVLAAATPMSLMGQLSPTSPISPPLFAFPTPQSIPDDAGNHKEVDTVANKPIKPLLRPMHDESEPSPLPLIPDELPIKPSVDAGGYFSIRRRRRSSSLQSATTAPPTPALESLGSATSAPKPASPRRHLRGPAPLLGSVLHSMEGHVRGHADSLLWVLIGAPQTTTADQGLAAVGGIVGIAVHLISFAFFVLVHTWAFFVSIALTSRSVAYFLHWTFLNLTGRTDLSIVVKDYVVLCRAEWDVVYAEDGVRLSVWSIGLGLFELMAVQAMSKERWLAEGPGELSLLLEDADKPSSTNRPQSLRRQRSTRRRASTRHTFSPDDASQPGMMDGPGNSLLVTGGGDSIMEGRILNDPFDSLAFSPSFSPRTVPAKDDKDDLPPLDLNDTLPGFSFPPSPLAPSQKPVSPPLKPIEDEQDHTSTFVTLIQRHARLATASYGLHSYILAPPSPLFTPGVNHETLPHRVFTHLGGIDHKTSSVLHVAIQKHYTGVPAQSQELEEVYEPQFYLLRDDLHGEVICVVRGTQSLADIRTDLEAGLEEVALPSLGSGTETETFLAHAGILAAARRLLEPQSPLFTKLKAALEETGYSLVFNGHSLGAAIASTLAFLIGTYTTPTRGDSEECADERGTWTTSPACGLPPGRPVRAICFAHPASVGIPLAQRCSLGITPLVISISYGPDAVTRMGIPQVRELRRALGRLAQHRRKWVERKASAEGKHGKSEILSAWWKWRALDGSKDDESEQNDARRKEREELERRAWRWRKEVDGVASETSKTSAIPAGKCYQVDRLPSRLELARRQQLEEDIACRLAAGEEDVDDDDEALIVGLYSVGRPAAFYAMPLLEANLVKCHLPREYLDAINAL